MNIIANIHTDFPEKFGIPRQSRRINDLIGKIIFTPEYRNSDFIRGIEEYSHLWLIWIFSANTSSKHLKPTVRPPRLGGNKRVGVLATRSPFRPNPIGLSCVKLEKIEKHKDYGNILYVSGIDMLDNTPILDIKPYIAYTDSIADAKCSFSDDFKNHSLEVLCRDEVKSKVSKDDFLKIEKILKDDPCPAYHSDDKRIYGFKFSKYEIKFIKQNNTITILEIS